MARTATPQHADPRRSSRAAWQSLDRSRRREVFRAARRGQRPADELALALGQEAAQQRLTPSESDWERRMRRVLGPWSLVGASLAVTAETGVFVGVGVVPLTTGAAALAVALLCGLVGAMRLRGDRLAAQLLDLGRMPSRQAIAQPRRAALRPAASAMTLPATSSLPRPRRSNEDTTTGPLTTV